MTRRTLADARTVLERDYAPNLTDYQMRQAQAVLTALEAVAKEAADKFIADREVEVEALRDVAMRELTAARDGFDDLTLEGATGRLSAAEYNTRLNGLKHRQELAEGDLAQAEEETASIEEIEADPVAWYDGLTAKSPMLLSEVPW